MDDPRLENLEEDLKGIVKGTILLDDLSRALYSTDASIFQIMPLGVVIPRDEEDVQALVRYAAEHCIPLAPRGAGTGVAGEALSNGLIVDLSQHFRSILETKEDTVRVQPGVVYRNLNEHLAARGRRFAPDPASGGQCTIGGMLATNASGAHVLKHGYTRDYVESVRAVLANGDLVQVGRQPRPPWTSNQGERLDEIVGSLTSLLVRHEELIGSSQPQTRFNRCGYLLHNLLEADSIHLARLLVGSEGTLAFFTEATLRTVPLPAGHSLVLLGFSDLEAAIRASQASLCSRPAACDLIDRRLLSLARGSATELAPLISPAAEAVLLIEFEADTADGARQAAHELVDRLHHKKHLSLYALQAFEHEEIERLWRLREAALPSLYGMRSGVQPVAFVEDVGVPVGVLSGYLHGVQEILQRFETTASFLVHAGSGQVHTRPFLDLSKPGDVNKLWALAEEIHSLALQFGGTVSSQHGTGLARTPWVSRQYRRLYPVFQEIKQIFDPQEILNPGKIIGPAAGMPTWPLRRSPPSNGDAGRWQLRWQPGEVRGECVNCNGCGACRTEAPQRMCPIFRATHAETATPRAKANLLRHLLDEETDSRFLASDAVREVADLCVNCRMCAQECPAHVNIPKLMLEAKAAHVAEHGLDRTNWVLSRTEAFAALGSTWALLANAALRSRTIRWLMEKFFGVSRRRRLPAFANRSFLRRADRRGWTRPRRHSGLRYAYFVDVFANFNDPSMAEAVVAVLGHQGLEVYVPPDQRGSGMAPLAYGDVEAARETALYNIRLLSEAVREGYTILCAEPTAALMLRHDYLDLVDDPDAALVAEHTAELTGVLGQLQRESKLRTDFQTLDFTIGYHLPCHLKTIDRAPQGPSVLSLIPGLQVNTIDVSCSGMAGTFGLKAENYDVSLEAGRPMLDALRRPEVQYGCTECSTCRLQMEDGGRKRTMHPVQYLALAYGLMPELARRLKSPIRELVL